MTAPASQTPRCPECGAEHHAGARRCWLCGAELAGEPSAAPASTSADTEATAATFSLSSLFLVMTLVAVCAGVFAAAPGLGIIFAVLATPALVRTIFITAKQKSRGTAVTPGQKIVRFLGSIGVVLLVFLSIGVALLTACLTACAGYELDPNKGTFIFPSMVIGGVVGLPLAGWLLWLIWRWQRKA